MRKTTAVLVAGTLLLGTALVAPAGAHDGVRPTFRTQEVWYHCTGTTKVYQVNWLSQLGSSSAYMPWDTMPPAGGVADGAGCGAADVGGVTNAFYSPVFLGYHEGNLRDITVRLHHMLLSNRRQGAPMDLSVHLEIDGVPVFPEGPGAGGRVTVTPRPANNGMTEVFEFTITNLGFAEEIVDGNGVTVAHGGLAKEDGDGSQEREILLMVGLSNYPEPGAWVWDTTEVPSGMTFNAAEPAAARVKASMPR